MSALNFEWSEAVRHVSRRDRKLARIIRAHGDAPMVLKRLRTPFHALMRAIIFQQLSGKAAGTIHGRVLDLFPDRRQVTAARLLELSDARLRGAGVSFNKMKSLRDLAQRTVDGEIPGFAKLERMDDEEIIERLTQVRGIGRWTVEMLLIFHLGRPDVLPVDDLGVRKGFAQAHGLEEMPTPKELTELASHWRPFRTVGSWYCWRALEL
jgi:3-methyladenine DNA glycosylase/8-oxoguanine DNA glycosylase